jgi:hypothetical protein
MVAQPGVCDADMHDARVEVVRHARRKAAADNDETCAHFEGAENIQTAAPFIFGEPRSGENEAVL